jgi:hypothetical protein
MNDEDRNREERRREEKQREAEELQHRKGAEDDAIYYEGLRSGDYSRWLARRGYVSPADASEVGQTVDDEASVVGPIDKQAWQDEAMEAVYEAQQSLWASILHLSGPHNSSWETGILNDLLTATTLSADDENILNTIDRHIYSSEMNDRFSDLTNDLRWLKSKIEEYRLVKEMASR